MEKQTSGKQKSSMFLIELIISVLFLSLCSAICIRLFVNSRLTANESYNLTHAVISAQNIAEVFEAGADKSFRPILPAASVQSISISEYMSEYFYGSQIQDTSESSSLHTADETNKKLMIYYNNDFEPCTPDDSSFIAYVTFTYEKYQVSIDISIENVIDTSSSNNSIYTLHVDHAVSIKGGVLL